MAKFKTIITTAGAAKIAAVLAGTGSIVLDNTAKMAVGDGGGTLPTPTPAQTKLVNEVHRASINKASIDASDPKNIIAELVIPPETGGFWLREMALYDAAGTLLAVGNMAETYKPSLSEGAGRKMVIRMVIAVSEVTAITITMDTSTVMATQDYVDSEIDKHEKSRNHPDATLTAKGFTQLNSATDNASETQAATPKAVKTVMDATNLKAPLASPALSGVPTAPTAPPGTNTQQLANTAFVRAAIAALINSSPGVLDTLGELAAAMGNDANFATTMTNALAGKQPKDATLTNLSGKDVAGLLTYLGLTNYADKKSGTSQIFDAPVVSNDGIVAQYGTAKVILSAQNGLKLITYQNGQYTGGIEIPKQDGVFALKSDIAALVNSSPAALDTLKELADALGGDANFATTMLNALAGKQPKDTTLTNLSGKDVAGLLQYLGLTYYADKNSLASQDFKGPITSLDNIVAQSPNLLNKLLLSATNTGVSLVTYKDGKYSGGIAVPTKTGTMALTSDLSNFADKSSADEQSFSGPLSSGDGVIAKYGTAKIILSAQNGQRIIVYTDNTYRGGINIPLRDGTMALTADLFGVSQTWQNVKTSRSAGVNYTNSTGRPIAVSIAGIMASNQTGVQLSLAVNGVEASSFAVTLSNFDIRGNVFAIVPPGATYNLTANSITSILTWSELR